MVRSFLLFSLLRKQKFHCELRSLVGPSGLEPPTSCLSGTRSNLLSYEPMWLVWILFTLELFTFALAKISLACEFHFCISKNFTLTLVKISLQALGLLGGDDGIRTHDPLLAGQVLSQLSYTPIKWFVVSPFSRHSESGLLRSPFVYVSIGLSSRTASREVLSPLQSLTSVFGMGTGGPSAFVTLTFADTSAPTKAYALKIEQH